MPSRRPAPFWTAALAALSATVGCERLLVEPATSFRANLAVSYHLSPRFAQFASGPGAAFDKADRLRIRVAHAGGVLADTTIPFTPAPEVRVRLPLDVPEPIAVAQVVVELLKGNDPLFFGTDTLALMPGETTESRAAAVGLMPRPAGLVVPRSVRIDGVGDTVQLTGAAVFATGDTVPDSPITWAAVDSGVVEVSPAGRVVSRANGTARVVGTAAGRTDTTRVTVLAQTGPARVDLTLAHGMASSDVHGRADRLWVHVARDGAQVLDTILPYDPTAPTGVLALTLPGRRASDSLTVAVELRQGTHPVVRGIGPLVARPHETVSASVALASNVPTVAVGSDHACGLAQDGAPLCWGSNDRGQIGDANVPWVGTTAATAVVGSPRLQSLTAGFKATCGLDAAGQAYCWGGNEAGNLGNGRVEPAWPHAQTTPTQVVGGIAFTTVTLGGDWNGFGNHSCGLTADGVAYCWGDNGKGQLGTGGGSTTAPAAVAGGLRFSEISAGAGYTCGVTTRGEGYCWGSDESGRLGNGAGTGAGTPVRLSTTRRLLSITAGLHHACAVDVTGTAWCWGDNSGGGLGVGMFGGQRDAPTRVEGGVAFRSLQINQHYTCGLAASGVAHCWGGNYLGRTGHGTHEGFATPRPLAGAPRFTSLSAGSMTACGRDEAGTLSCWGGRGRGQIGDGVLGLSPTPVRVSGPAFVQSSTGGQHSCAVDAGGQAYCWGDNSNGQLGRGSVGNQASSAVPAQAAAGLRLRSVAAGAYHTCGLDTTGRAHCWGGGSVSQMGDGSSALSPRPTPVPVAGGLTLETIDAGSHHTCGLTAAGAAYCWGDNRFGQLGDGSRAARTEPVAVAGGLTFSSIRPGGGHTCGVTTGGAAYCWGRGEDGQLGDGARSDSAVPVRVAGGLTFRVVDPSDGDQILLADYTCGIASDGAAYCWGSESGCALGNPSCDPNRYVLTPQPVMGGHRFTDVSSSPWSSCALSTGGQTLCWGSHYWGTLGYPFQDERIGSTRYDPGSSEPRPIALATTLTSVELATDTACGLAAGGAAYCWGHARYGELGNGAVGYVLSPTAVHRGTRFR